MAFSFTDLHTEAGLKNLEEFLSGKTYISGDQITKDDIRVYAAVTGKPGAGFPNASRWHETVSSALASRFPGEAAGVKIGGQAATPIPSTVSAAETEKSSFLKPTVGKEVHALEEMLDGETGQIKSEMEKRFSLMEDRLSSTSKMMMKILEFYVPQSSSVTGMTSVDQLRVEIPKVHLRVIELEKKNQEDNLSQPQDSQIRVWGGGINSLGARLLPTASHDGKTRMDPRHGECVEEYGLHHSGGTERWEPRKTWEVGKRTNGERGVLQNERGMRKGVHSGWDSRRGENDRDKYGYWGGEAIVRKLKMPVFKGKDALRWLYRVERYFIMNGLNEKEKLMVVALYLKGKALAWFRFRKATCPFRSWEEFENCFLERFRANQEGNLYEQFFVLTQEGSIMEYRERFELLLGRLRGISEAVLEGNFMKELKPDIRRVLRPRGFEEIMELAQIVEDKNQMEMTNMINIVGGSYESDSAMLTPSTQTLGQLQKLHKDKEAPVAAPAHEEDDDDLDLFGDETEDEKKAAADREASKASAKKKESGKSSVLLDVKPWDDETDMVSLEKAVRSVQMEGLLWGASKLAPVGYGIKKLQIMMTIVDDLVSVDSLIEEHLTVEPCNEFIQSCDIVAFNKI